MSAEINAYDNISSEELKILSDSCNPNEYLFKLNRIITKPPVGMMLADVQALYASQIASTEEN